ncbi:methyltransferase family protein [Algoriphagus ratkowskyi]|uniref:Class I SAM-dependent methyltransferase n=1 Tax=Algoriphagus ratkowskyi TaxID=57028 RepID=A0A2W7RDT7_9BACT|nr:class I SAM-dependent methyltransferase [Algoriphagus ratkowskyi]PZX58291.1 methyltransferase family protein [Algoriphagus ratkowskyi]TXD77831.1 class I SAM-dependent methyltransferase [Algoriphagus ratkowskyi]
MNISELNKLLGNIDIYLLDQILKGRFSTEMIILDAGCGEGRNAVYFVNGAYQIFGIDQNETAIQYCRYMSKSLDKSYDSHRFQVAGLEEIPFHKEAFDAVICSAVLHFANDETNFWQMMDEMLRVLKPGGVLWFRMTTAFGGILENSQALGEGKYLLPDGSSRFLLTEAHVNKLQERGLRFLEHPKSVLVHGQRTMGVFVMEKTI